MRLRIALGLCLALFGAGCVAAPDTASDNCGSCGADELCYEGECRFVCNVSDDCRAVEICLGGLCLPRDGAECGVDADCAETVSDCRLPPYQNCRDGRCVLPNAAPDSLPCTRPGGGAGHCRDGECAECAVVADCTTPDGDPDCVLATACNAGACVYTYDTSGACTPQCDEESDCPAPAECRITPSPRCVSGACAAEEIAPDSTDCTRPGGSAGHCRDGVCTECAVAADCTTPDGRPACVQSTSCNGGLCVYVYNAGQTCEPITCADGAIEAARTCGIDGACPHATQTPCGGYACASGTPTCRDTCGGNEHCAAGFLCDVANDCVSDGSLPAPTLSGIDVGFGPLGGGHVISLTGTGFLPAPVIRINGVACAVSATSSATSATCQTPAGSGGPHDVSLTNQDAQVATLVDAYTYVGPPTLTQVSPTTSSTAGGATLTLTGTGFRPGLSVTVGGVTCTSPVRNSAVSATCVLPAGSGADLDVVLSNADGQIGTLVDGFDYGPAVLDFVVGSASPTPPDPADYGTISGHEDLHFTLTNSGISPSSTVDLSVTGNDPTRFTIVGGTCVDGTTVLNPNASCTVQVRTYPYGATAGLKTANLQASATAGGTTTHGLRVTFAFTWKPYPFEDEYLISTNHNGGTPPSGACTTNAAQHYTLIASVPSGSQVSYTKNSAYDGSCTPPRVGYQYTPGVTDYVRQCGTTSPTWTYINPTYGCFDSSATTVWASVFNAATGVVDSCDTSFVYITRMYVCN